MSVAPLEVMQGGGMGTTINVFPSHSLSHTHTKFGKKKSEPQTAENNGTDQIMLQQYPRPRSIDQPRRSNAAGGDLDGICLPDQDEASARHRQAAKDINKLEFQTHLMLSKVSDELVPYVTSADKV